MTKAADWPDRPVEDLVAELGQCREQARLLADSLLDLRSRGEGEGADDAARRERRITLQEQTRSITEAYAEALRRHLEGRAVRS